MPRLLNEGNRGLLDAGLAAVSPSAGERVADVGFGGVIRCRQMASLVAPERPVGVELSEAMIEAARAELGATADLYQTDVAALPLPAASLDAVLSVNTIYFWPDPAAALREVRRVLKPGRRASGSAHAAAPLVACTSHA
jgi:arsenite methyltransferase